MEFVKEFCQYIVFQEWKPQGFAEKLLLWYKVIQLFFFIFSEELWYVACYLISERASQRSIHTIE